MKIKIPESVSESFDLEFREDSPFDVVGFGLNSIDHFYVVTEYPDRAGKAEIVQFEQLPGGQVATALTFLARMGLCARYIGKVGDDETGRASLKSLNAESLDTSSVLIEKGIRNSFSVIIIDQKSGERTVLYQRDKGLDFRNSELNEEIICSGKVLHLDGYDRASIEAARFCQRNGIAVCADLDTVVPNCDALLECVDFLIVSSNFPSEFTGITNRDDAFLKLRNSYDGFLAMTLGNRGCQAWMGGQCIHFPAQLINAVDTTGSGDIFHGAFIFGLLENWSIGKIMAFSNAAAGLSCLHLGARSGIRPLSEILNYIDSNNR